MPSQTCGFNENGELKWFDGGRLPAGWSHDNPTLEKEAIPGDVQPGDGDGTLQGSDPDTDAQEVADKEAEEAADAQAVADKEAKEAEDAQAVADKEKKEAVDAQKKADKAAKNKKK